MTVELVDCKLADGMLLVRVGVERFEGLKSVIVVTVVSVDANVVEVAVD